jgi:hypothetical protein
MRIAALPFGMPAGQDSMTEHHQPPKTSIFPLFINGLTFLYRLSRDLGGVAATLLIPIQPKG